MNVFDSDSQSILAAQGARRSPLWQKEDVEPLINRLVEIRSDMLHLEASAEGLLQTIASDRWASARNLLHYVALRRHDIRELQEQLVLRGLSSLGRCESYVMANVETVLQILGGATGTSVQSLPEERTPVNFFSGRSLLAQSTQALLGTSDSAAGPTIMVTMPSEASEDYSLVRDLLAAGMGVMRINCAHDDTNTWGAMISNLRRAEDELGVACRVAMDLGGPKIRTGPLEPGPRVLRWRPHRDAFGHVLVPARIWISPAASESPPPVEADAIVPVTDDWWQRLEAGEELLLEDAAGRKRQLVVVQKSERGLWAESRETTYIVAETVVRRGPGDSDAPPLEGRFGPLSPLEGSLVLRKGDKLLVTDAETPGKPAKYDDQGRLIRSASIGCTLPHIFRDVRRGDRILFDDGKIAGVVEEASTSHLLVEITRARAQGQRLRADKGINLPDSDLQLPALTEKDVQDLQFVAKHADMVSYSFVRRAEDIQQLFAELERLGRMDLGVILKIENRQAFNNLPRLLLEVIRSPASGVMIARGDLAVECGWERLAEMQEEILWMCEAAHMPVIWATQVLEGLAKNGLPTRAEVTDAAMGARAECVMLNKGPNIVETVHTLNDILRRMQSHQIKKRATFRRLRMADQLFTE